MYRSESWPLSKKDENILQIFEIIILRRICGPVNEGGMWRIRYNNELYKLYNETDIIRVIKIERLRWLGHIQNARAGPLQKVNTLQTTEHLTCRET
jgi:hypothetical protein